LAFGGGGEVIGTATFIQPQFDLVEMPTKRQSPAVSSIPSTEKTIEINVHQDSDSSSSSSSDDDTGSN
jgi:hypothetical protein